MTFITRRMTTQLQSIDLAPLAAATLRAFVEERRHQALFDDFLRIIHDTMTQAETMAMIRAKIRAELPTLLRLYRADKFLVNKIVASATAFLEEVRNDTKHPFRGEFDRMVLSFVDRLGTDKSYADRIDGLKRDLLARPELTALARNIWSNMRSFIERSASGETQVLRHHLAGMFVAAVKAWNMAQLISLIEINIGKDLQYIRFNGSLIGGLAGLALYTAEFLLRLL